MGNLCIIPARGGSKRIPRKNIKTFLGKPIIAYSIELALNSGLFDEVMVSTDDAEISEVAKSFGAEVPFARSAENANDFATTMAVLKEVLAAYEKQGRTFENVCCIYPTAPLIQEKALREGFEKLRSENLASVYPVTPFSFPIWRSVKIEAGKTKMNWPEFANARSQDLPKAYHDAGQWYWFVPAKIGESLYSENSGAVVLSELEVQDIDSETDWQMAELKYERIHRST
jgi:N-acylneuraminate cytidylyltransferase